MYSFLLSIIIISIVIFIFECAYVFYHISTKMHAYLFFYLLASVINNAGYLLEMTAKSSEAAYVATRLLYLGKINVSFCLLMFVLLFCKAKFPKMLPFGIFGLHVVLYMFILTNDFHHLYYSSIDFVNTGLFPHNVYGHGPIYYVYIVLPFIYAIIAAWMAFKAYKKMRTKEEKTQVVFLFISPIASLLGTLIFLTGKTGGFDTSNIGMIVTSVCMLMSLFRYKLIDSVDMVRQTITDSLNDGVVVIDSYDNVAYANEMAKKLLPALNDDSTMDTHSFIADLDNKALRKERLKVLDREYLVTVQRLYQKNIYRGKLFVLDDMTDTVNYTKQIEDERDRADRANAAKSNFLSNMSHEIRTPMNAVVGMTDIMLRNNPSEPDKSYLENIKNSGNALLDIINDILDLSKIESGKMEIINDNYELVPLLNDLKIIFSTRIGDRPLRLIYEIDENLPSILYGDSVRIRQIIINIMNNAIKFTDVGYVRLKVNYKKIDEDNVNISISIKDSGQGIKEDEIGKLFDSFTRIDEKKNHGKEGTGLGLTITRQLLELMHGTIEVESFYGRGTEFFINIPQKVIDFTPAGEVTYKKKDEDIINFTAPDARILLVEDNEVNVRVAKGLLEPLKFSMDVADNGLTALKKVSENKYDLILMDHMMPVMDGIEATKHIRAFEDEYYKRLPIIALTANAIVEARAEFEKAGMNDFVGKPINMKEICVTLKKWLPESKVILEKPEYKDDPMDTEINSIYEDIENNIDSQINIYNQKGETKMGELGALDREVGIQYCGMEELYEEVLNDFYKLIDSKSEKIETLLKDNDIRNYTIEVHALKSTARMIGATELSELAFKMEQAGNANDLDLINAETPRLMEMYRAYKKTLAYFDENNASDKEEVPVSTIKAELFKLNLAAKDFDMDVVDATMAKLNGYKMPNADLDKKISDLDTIVRDVDFEGIKALTTEIMHLL